MSEAKRLPERVDPRRLALGGGSVEGELALADLRRLAEYLLVDEVPDSGRASLFLAFDEDPQRRVRITGNLRAVLTLQCQRCLGPVTWTVDQPLRLVAVADDEAAAGVPREYEPVVVPAEGLDPAALAEDELILALPLVARCERSECDGAAEAAAGSERADNPFAALAALRGRNGGRRDE